MNLEAVRAHVEVVRFCKRKQAEYKEMEERSRAAIEEAMGADEVGELDGEQVIVWKHITSRRLDQKALKAAHPSLADEFMVTSESRRFEVET